MVYKMNEMFLTTVSTKYIFLLITIYIYVFLNYGFLWLSFYIYVLVLIILSIHFIRFNVSNLSILPPWRSSHGWPKYVGGNCVYQLTSIYLCAFVDTVVAYIRIMHGLWLIWNLFWYVISTHRGHDEDFCNVKLLVYVRVVTTRRCRFISMFSLNVRLSTCDIGISIIHNS
jgi:hypothetical protein